MAATLQPASLLPWTLLFARVLPLCLVLVGVTRRVLGWTVALSLGAALMAALSVGTPLESAARTGADTSLLLLLARELCLGALVALALLLPLAAAGWAARFSELAAGPWGHRAGPLSTLYLLAATFLCLTLGIHRSLLIGLHESLRLAPLAASSFVGAEFGLGVVRLVGEAFALSFALGLPLLCSFLLIEAVLCMVRRLFGRGPGEAFGPALSRPLLYLLAAALLWPAVSEVPSALRHGMRLLRELTLRVAS